MLSYAEQMDLAVKTSALMKLVFMIAAGTAWWLLMRMVSHSQHWAWSDIRSELVKGNVAVAIHRAAIAIALAIVMGMAVGCSSAHAGVFPAVYDDTIREAWALYHPGDDPNWWKAQLWQESNLKPDARSPVGAEGIAQFMPATALQYGLVDRRLAEPSILAGARMMRDMMRFWKAPRTPASRRRLAQASYNAGAGNLLKAQTRCKGHREYEQIMECLPAVTGVRNARETAGYAPRIQRWREAML